MTDCVNPPTSGKRAITTVAAVLVLGMLTLPTGTARAGELNLTETGSSLLYPLFNVWVTEYTKTHPGIHISTAEGFSRCRPDDSGPSLRSIITQPITQWKDILTNDFEAPLFSEYPVLREIKQSLYDRGAIYASMTGSGSCVFGIFEKGLPAGEVWPGEVISILAKK